MEIDAYSIAWATSGLGFCLGGALLLDRKCRRAGNQSGVFLRIGPAIALILAIAGAKLHPFLENPAELAKIIASGKLLVTLSHSGQRIAGGLLLATAFLGVVLPRLCRGALSGWSILDEMAPLSGMTMALGRLGCLAAGCCFGALCEGAFCLDYGHGTPAWWNHFARNLLPEDAHRSLAVHPLPLYLGGLGVVSATSAWIVQHRQWPPGSSFLIFVAIFSGGRLWIEAWRESILLVEIPQQAGIDQILFAGALVRLLYQWRRTQPAGASDNHESRNDGSSSPGIPNA